MSSYSLNLVYPLFAMFLLSAVVLITMFRTRVRAVKSGQIKAGYFKTYEGVNLPEDVIKTARHFSNLFETPVLFYVICIVGIIFSVESMLFIALAWAYVVARSIHAYIHIGRNKLPLRMLTYTLSWLIMAGMWAVLFVKLVI